MSNPSHESEKRDLELYIKLFGYISILGRSEEVNLRQELDKEEKRFHRNLDRLAKCQSCFQEGIKFPSTNKESENGESIKENDHLTVLHKAITVFKLSRKKDGKRSSPESHHTNTKKLKIKQDDNGSVEETHHENALKCTVECKQKCAQQRVILFILEHYLKLLYCNRDNSTQFCGQTPLHMAITKENKYLVKLLLDYARNDKEHGVKELLSQSATGLSFKNNVMMGQLPLSVAVLTANKDIVKLLLQQSEIHVCQKNEDGDTLFHSLLKYAYVFLDREDDAKEMIELIKKEKNDCWKKLLLMENKSNDTPLTLAAKNGQIEMIHYILERVIARGMIHQGFLTLSFTI